MPTDIPPIIPSTTEAHAESATMIFFNMGAIVGFGSILFGIIQKKTASELTSNITGAFLMSISGNCSRILAKHDAYGSEKLFISCAVATYAYALFLDCTSYSITLAVKLKLLTTGCVGAWNTRQIDRLNITQPNHHLNQPHIPKIAYLFYGFGAILGHVTAGVGFFKSTSINSIKPFITFAFLMSHVGNFFRTEFNPNAKFLERYFIRAVIFFYSIALLCDFIQNEKMAYLAAYTKLVAATFVGLWNTALTLRLHPYVYDHISAILHPLHKISLFPHESHNHSWIESLSFYKRDPKATHKITKSPRQSGIERASTSLDLDDHPDLNSPENQTHAIEHSPQVFS